MKYLLKKARIVANKSISSAKDILIDNGKIIEIATSVIDDDAQMIRSKNLHVSIGWLDIGTTISEPGHEERETLFSLSEAASHGGYTGIAGFPTTTPVMDNKSTISYVTGFFEDTNIDYYPIGALSLNRDGRELTEMIDLTEVGAVAFSDGMRSSMDSGNLMRALQYARRTNRPIIHFPMDMSISRDAEVHEGIISTSLGLPGIPKIAETIMVKRDIELANYAEGHLIEHNISVAQSVKSIKNNKSNHVQCAVAAMNLAHTDEMIKDFNPLYKVKPPLRDSSNQSKLINAIIKDQIQYISSNHTPIERESKDLEFTNSAIGASTIDSAFASLNTFCKNLPLEILVHKLTEGPRLALSIDIPKIKVGELANLTLFDPTRNWQVTESSIKSKSKNNPYLGTELKGFIIGTMNKNLFKTQ